MKKIIFTGGGTGGHIYPNLALMNDLKNKYQIIYIGSKNSMEKKLVKDNYKFYGIDTVKFVRSLSLKNLLIPFKLFSSIKQAKKILKQEKPDLIFSKGGFVSLPVVLAGNKLGIPCITHESDLSLGLANKLIKNKCKYVCTSFDKVAKSLKNGIHTGSPIRKEIFNANKTYFSKQFPIKNNKPNLLIFGGSLGSKVINNIVFENIGELCKDYNIFHIVGKNNTKKINEKDYYQFEYVNNIENLFAGADIIITRGGSNALFEILCIKKPMLIIPLSKQASRGDQIENAKYFYENGFANILYEEDLSIDNLQNAIKTTLKNKDSYIQNMSKATAYGNKNIINLIDKTINEK